MSKAKEDQIEKWQFGSAESRKHLGKLEKQTEAIKEVKQFWIQELSRKKRKKY